MRDLLAVVWENLFLLILGLLIGIGLALIVYANTTRIYESQAKFVVGKFPSINMAGFSDAESEARFTQNILLSIAAPDVKMAVAKRLGIAPERLAFTAIERKKDLTGTLPEANIRVDLVRQSRVAELTVVSQDQEFAVAAANTMLDELKVYNVVGALLTDLRNDLSLATSKSDNLIRQLTEVSGARIKVERQNAELSEHLQRRGSLAEFPAFATDGTLNNLKTQFILVESEYRQLAAVASRGPRLDGKRAEVASLKQQIDAHVDGLVNALHSELEVAKRQEAAVSNELDGVTAQIQQLGNEAGTLYQSLGDAAKMRQLAEKRGPGYGADSNLIVPIVLATPAPKPEWPKLWLNLLLGTVFGTALGAAAIAARLALDYRIKSPAKIADRTGLPTLALLPNFKPLYRQSSKKRPEVEPEEYPAGLDFLRSTLIRRRDDVHRQVIGICPVETPRPFPNLTANLAILLAHAGQRTLVIDLHFAAPRQETLLGIPCTEGLAEWLASNRPLHTFIHQGSNPSLAVISTGEATPNTDHLFSQNLLQKELKALLNDWDFILLDAPPLLQNWTMSMALPERHAVILTADYGETTFEELEKAVSVASNNKWNVLGVVLQRCPQAICDASGVVVEQMESGGTMKAAQLPDGHEQRH